MRYQITAYLEELGSAKIRDLLLSKGCTIIKRNLDTDSIVEITRPSNIILPSHDNDDRDGLNCWYEAHYEGSHEGEADEIWLALGKDSATISRTFSDARDEPHRIH